MNLTKKKASPAKPDKQLIQTAQQQIFDLVQELDDMKSFINALSEAGARLFIRASSTHKDFFDGLKLINQALNAKYTDALSMCVPLIGAGGEAAKKFSRDRFRNIFGAGDKQVLAFLDKYGNMPDHWDNQDAVALKQEADAIINEHKASSEPVRKLNTAAPVRKTAPEPEPEYEADPVVAPADDFWDDEDED